MLGFIAVVVLSRIILIRSKKEAAKHVMKTDKPEIIELDEEEK